LYTEISVSLSSTGRKSKNKTNFIIQASFMLACIYIMAGDWIMKKILRLYKPYMIRPIIYKTATKASIALTVVLLWNYWINTKSFMSLEDGFFIVGLTVTLLSWFNYLKLDGIRINMNSNHKEKKKKHRTSDIIDFADEKIISFDELEVDEQEACKLASSFITGCIFLLTAIVKTII